MADERALRIPNSILVLTGLWLVVTPWILGDAAGSGPGRANSVGVGIVVTLLAASNLWTDEKSRASSGLIAILGLWMLAAPFVLGYSGNPPWTWSSVITGVVVVGLALVDMTARTVAQAPPELARMVHGPWIGGRYFPGFAYEFEDFPLYPLSRWLESMGREAGAWQGEFRGVGPRGWRRPDEQILGDICAHMADHPRLDASEIEVAVSNGEVTLQGTVSNRAGRRLAEDIADSVSGVRDVANELRMRSGDREIRRVA
jgi:hypothetical protein